jgi:hypothetical protein
MAKPRLSIMALPHKEPIHKKTRQGNGRGSKPRRGRKLPIGQGR